MPKVISSRIETAEVVFFRHGQSEWNTLYDHAADKIKNYFRSRDRMFWDTPLSPNGVHDAMYIARLLLQFAAEDPANVIESRAADAITQLFESSGLAAVPAYVALDTIASVELDELDRDIYPESALGMFAAKVMNPRQRVRVLTSNLHRAMDTGYLAMIPRFAIDPNFRIIVHSDLQETDANGDCEATSPERIKIGPLVKDSERTDPYGDQKAQFVEAGADALYQALKKLYPRQNVIFNMGNNPIVGSKNENDGELYTLREQLSSVKMGFKGYTSGADVTGNFGNRIHFTAPPSGGRQVDIMSPFHAILYDDTLNVFFSHSRLFKDLVYNFARVSNEQLPLLQEIARVAADAGGDHAHLAHVIATTPYATTCGQAPFATKKLEPGSGVRFDVVRFTYRTEDEPETDRFVVLMGNCKYLIPSKSNAHE